MKVEHLDDLPLLAEQLRKSGLAKIFDKHYPDHGHWKGISGGKLLEGWLLYILSESDHRLSHVEDWASDRLEVLSAVLREPELRSLDFSDDRLGRLLDRYSDDEQWNNLEESLGKKLLKVYSLNEEKNDLMVVRSDSFNVPQFRAITDLFTRGYSKQRRSDQPFCKAMLSSLDPLSMPLAVEVVKGGGTDVSYYLTVINRVQKILPGKGNLYVGDSQLGSIGNRTEIHKSGDYYLSPLGKKQCKEEVLHHYLDQIKQEVHELPSIFTEEDVKRKPAYFFELTETVNNEEEKLQWVERRVLVYSPAYAKEQIKSFDNRLSNAELAIQNLVLSKQGRRNPKTLAGLHGRVAAELKKYRVEGNFEISCKEEKEQVEIKRHKNRPTRTEHRVKLSLKIKRNHAVIEHMIKRLGWQVYASNAPKDLIKTADLVKCYRDEYRIEHLFDYYLNRDVGLLPVYLQKEERVKGLIRLLSVAMRFSVLIQHHVRIELAKRKEKLSGIYPGNKNRSTNKPTTPMLLRAFKGVFIVWTEANGKSAIEMTKLKVNQENILDLLGLSKLYDKTLKSLKTQMILRGR